MRRFSLYKRGKYFYVQFRNDETGKYLSGKSTGCTNRNEAIVRVLNWEEEPDHRVETDHRIAVDTIVQTIRSTALNEGDLKRIIAALNDITPGISIRADTGAAGEAFIDFLKRFWNYDESPYVAEKKAHGQTIGKRRCIDMTYAVNGHWTRSFPDRTLGDVTRRDLSEFGVHLANRGLAAKTINHIIQAGTVALTWAHSNELISSNPAANLRKFSGRSAKRGILTIDEAKALFDLRWEDDRARTANLVAATTGLRAGEIAALRLQDIGEDTLSVMHAWSNDDGLKSPKNGEQRTVPLLPEVRRHLLRLVEENPWQHGPQAWVMWSTRTPSRPVDPQHFYRELMKTLPRLRVTQEEYEEFTVRKRERRYWEERKIVFHSWRHFYTSRMAENLEKEKVMLATGHKSGVVFDTYADHVSQEVLTEVAGVTRQVFHRLVS